MQRVLEAQVSEASSQQLREEDRHELAALQNANKDLWCGPFLLSCMPMDNGLSSTCCFRTDSHDIARLQSEAQDRLSHATQACTAEQVEAGLLLLFGAVGGFL